MDFREVIKAYEIFISHGLDISSLLGKGLQLTGNENIRGKITESEQTNAIYYQETRRNSFFLESISRGSIRLI